ncbi:unnamed protein product [Oppiella nova]|uniref:Protein kinase domain-containing protein n=1 Tax=Oppiella nova TaxID=334625 RepID=A0A7R9MDL2_9ACAR|nr:unnamed protein product [Oppiella nova]CAG2174206.1 unnamed protein product [Oppiella nova]
MQEMQKLIKVRSEYCVQYNNQWYDNKMFYIQMELCSHSLQKILEHKPQVFGRQPEEPMNSIEFYISCHIFKEILECVQYLHELNPPVIHRDLKPDNILVAKTLRNRRFFKICDFGLATVHQHSSDKGDLRYQAPEVGQKGVVYNHKIDVYSLAIIAENDIFGVHLEDKLHTRPSLDRQTRVFTSLLQVVPIRWEPMKYRNSCQIPDALNITDERLHVWWVSANYAAPEWAAPVVAAVEPNTGLPANPHQ